MKLFNLVFFFVVVQITMAQKMSQEEYAAMYADVAIQKMHEYAIPASITLAQGILESGSGNSTLARQANNHFGIKCHGWDGPGYYMDDDEANECFRKYNSPEESFADHSEFLTTRSRYRFLFTDYEVTDYASWAKGLKKAGYATNPHYADLLIKLIEKYKLFEYDQKDYVATVSGTTDTNTSSTTEEDPTLTIGEGAYYIDKTKGIFIYNRIKTIMSAGQSPMDIALTYDIPLDLLHKYNDLRHGDAFPVGTKIYLQPKRKKGAVKEHVVREGETMWEISQQYGIKRKKLYKKNKMTPDEQAQVGEVLFLRKKAKYPPEIRSIEEVLDEKRKQEEPVETEKMDAEPQKTEQSTQESPTTEEKAPIQNETRQTYTVQTGDTLYSISKMHATTVEELMKWNDLSDYNLKVGQVLVVSP